MNLQHYKYAILLTGFIGALLIAAPLISTILPSPQSETFSELYLFGPQHSAANYPSSIGTNEETSLFVGVTNDMGSFQYYMLEFKLANKTDPLPDSTTATPSTIQPFLTQSVLIQDGKTEEYSINLKITNASYSANQATIGNIEVNGLSYHINKQSERTNQIDTFSYKLIIELWIYNAQAQAFDYHNRYVSLSFQLKTT
jgi:uncharacterized membrane protein